MASTTSELGGTHPAEGPSAEAERSELPLVVSCESGLEALLVRELNRLGYPAEPIKPAKARVSGKDWSDVVRLNFWTRQANRVFLLLWVGEVGSLADIREVAGTVPFSRWMAPDQTFGVVGVREGTHDFTSVDIGREVGAAVVEHFLATAGVRVRAHLDDPDVQFFAELSDRHFMILLNTTGEPLTRRHPRRYQHFAPLKPPLAAALLELSSFAEGRPLLDPMAGGGTIPAEACFWAKGIPPGWFRKTYAFQRHVYLDSSLLDALRSQAQQNVRPCPVRIGAADNSAKNLRGMRANFQAFGILDEVRLWKDDARFLRQVQPGEYRLLVTNPPYGLRIGNPRVVRELYAAFPRAAREKGIDEIVLITPQRAWIQESLDAAGYRITDRFRFLYGSLETFLFRAVLEPA